MAKYRIRVEMIEGEDRERFEKTYGEGVECSGFVILGKHGDGHHSQISDLSTTSIAEMIANNDKIYAASLIAGAMREADETSCERKR